jgi:hypothetical protein
MSSSLVGSTDGGLRRAASCERQQAGWRVEPDGVADLRRLRG